MRLYISVHKFFLTCLLSMLVNVGREKQVEKFISGKYTESVKIGQWMDGMEKIISGVAKRE
jgi:hypothetical protein